MTAPESGAGLELFLATAPGLESALRDEAVAIGLPSPETVPGGVVTRGAWPDVWRANLRLRGASRVLVRIAEFRVLHLAQLDKRARRVDWAALLRPDEPVRVEATCERSRVYHAGAATQRVARAINETAGPPLAKDAAIRIAVRIVDDLCTLSVDASGEPLHRRGFKQAVAKAPLRETLAAAFLRQCRYDGREPVVDPMCGSGTFVIEAAELAAGLDPGRGRTFAFERLAGFDAGAWAAMKAERAPRETGLRFLGSDRNAGAVEMARANGERAGVGALCEFRRAAVGDATPPEGPPGLVMVNPPYGERIGAKGELRALYGALGKTLRERFAGWRVGLVTSEPALAAATGLPFEEVGPPVPHGPLRIRLHRTGPLGRDGARSARTRDDA